jgi:hypothetical protein
MSKPVLMPERQRIRTMAGYLGELEALELLDGGSVIGFSMNVKRKDGTIETFDTSSKNDSAVLSLRMKFWKERLGILIEKYRNEIETSLASMGK